MPALQATLNATDLFPSDMLPDMLAPFLAGKEDTQHWLTCEKDDHAIGFCFAKGEEMTDGTWNMLAIAVHPDHQGSGAGAALTQAMEQTLKATNARVLIVDTSGTEDFASTRQFYAKNGYDEEARIRDFWAAGDDKVIFHKAL